MKKKTLEQMTLSGSEEEILARLKERVDKAVAIIEDLRRERDALKAELEKRPDSGERLDQLERERESRRPVEDVIVALLDALRGGGPGRPRVIVGLGGMNHFQRKVEIAIEPALAEALPGPDGRYKRGGLGATVDMTGIR